MAPLAGARNFTLMRVADHLENLARKDDNTKSGPVKVEYEPWLVRILYVHIS